MILKSVIVAVILSIGSIRVSGISYSKVYMQSNVGGSHVYPGYEYMSYGAPAVSYVNPQIAQLIAPPLDSVLPSASVSSYYSPCVSACVAPCTTPCVPNQADNARLVAYNSPRLNVVVAPSKDNPTSYQYSYVVYDDNTGDHKAQREESDGNVVHGQYSFLQPDGYVRDVQYVADDVQGFNAVVNHFLPEASPKSPVIVIDTKKDSTPPCDVKSEAIKGEPQSKASYSAEKPNSKEVIHSAEKPLSKEAPGSAEKSDSIKAPHNAEKPQSKETPHSAEKPDSKEPHSVKKPDSKEATHSAEKPNSKETPQSAKKPDSKKATHSAEKPQSKEAPHSGEEVTSAEESKNALDPKNKLGKNKEVPKSGEKSIKEKPGKEVKKSRPSGHSDETSDEHAAHPAPKKRESREDVYEPVGNSYNDIFKCIQAAMNSGQPASPLSYIIVPYKPC